MCESFLQVVMELNSFRKSQGLANIQVEYIWDSQNMEIDSGTVITSWATPNSDQARIGKLFSRQIGLEEIHLLIQRDRVFLKNLLRCRGFVLEPLTELQGLSIQLVVGLAKRCSSVYRRCDKSEDWLG